MRPLFTPEELAEMAAADAENEAQLLTMDEIREARERDKAARHEKKDKRRQKLAENQRAYYEANREKIAEYQRAYYKANREKIAEYQRAYHKANREKIAENKRAYYEATPEARKAYNAYMREYMRKRREKKKTEKGAP